MHFCQELQSQELQSEEIARRTPRSIRLTFETSHDTIHSNTRYIAINSHNHNDDRGQHWEAQLRKGCLEMARQASLWQSRLYGLEILRSLSVRSQLDVAEGTLYPILSRLKAEGLLQSEWVEAEAGHPRKYYRLTAPGRRRAREMAEAWRTFAASLDDLLQPILGGKPR
jgi:PadR family transcriptional regulator, regulatory protein PadR